MYMKELCYLMQNSLWSCKDYYKTQKVFFREYYVFEFLNLPKPYSEKDLQKALISHLKDFMLEIGKDFTFVGEEFRIQVGKHDFFIDLLLFHRG